MTKLLSAVVVITLFVAGAAQAAPKQRAWQNGMWRDSQRNVGPTAGAVAVGSTVVVARRTTVQFVIETDEMQFLLEQRVKPKDPGLPMTVNGPAKFAVEGRDCYVVGEDGKEYKLLVLKKTLK